jgi:hypothetical protein
MNPISRAYLVETIGNRNTFSLKVYLMDLKFPPSTSIEPTIGTPCPTSKKTRFEASSRIANLRNSMLCVLDDAGQRNFVVGFVSESTSFGPMEIIFAMMNERCLYFFRHLNKE